MLRRLGTWLHSDLPARPEAAGSGLAIPVAAAALFTVARYHGEVSAFARIAAGLPSLPAISAISGHLYWFGMTALLLGAAPVALLRLLREPLGAYGLGLGRWRTGLPLSLALLAVMVPVVLVAARFPAFAGHYPLARGATSSLGAFAIYEAGYALYFVGWELVFRSFLLFGLYRRIGVLAVYVQALPFALLHFGKPEAEAFGSIVAGVALGYLALRTRSFWWGALLHAAVAVTMDVAAAWGRLAALP